MPRTVPDISRCWINVDWVNRGSFSLFKVKAARSKLSFYLSNVPSTVAELCARYEQSEEEMVREFIAFYTSTQKDCLTSETLSSFEHEVRAPCKGTHRVILHFCSPGEAGWHIEKSVGFLINLASSPNVSLDRLLNVSEPWFPLSGSRNAYFLGLLSELHENGCKSLRTMPSRW